LTKQSRGSGSKPRKRLLRWRCGAPSLGKLNFASFGGKTAIHSPSIGDGIEKGAPHPNRLGVGEEGMGSLKDKPTISQKKKRIIITEILLCFSKKRRGNNLQNHPIQKKGETPPSNEVERGGNARWLDSR